MLIVIGTGLILPLNSLTALSTLPSRFLHRRGVEKISVGGRRQDFRFGGKPDVGRGDVSGNDWVLSHVFISMSRVAHHHM